jgi:GMP synthase (glutamine-hydrolysing)
LIKEGFFADETSRDIYIADLQMLDREPTNKPLAWRYGIDDAVLDPSIRTAELANWITHQVLPTRASRGRA